MFKRIWLFLLMNAAVLLVFFVVTTILSSVFWINVWWSSYTWIFIAAAIFWFTWSFISLFLSKWMAKRAYNIVLINETNLYKLSDKERLVYDVVKDLAERNHIKIPEVGMYEDSEPNAFATWATKNSSLVAVSTGLLDLMDKDAIEWVIGHEMAHILNWDMVTMTLLQWVLNTFVIFFAKIIARAVEQFVDQNYATFARIAVDFVLQIIFWIIASMIAMWFSRYREFKADAWSAKYVWKEKMIAWLKALKDMQERMHAESSSKYATMQISTSRPKSKLMELFSSHPPLENRIKALEELKIY